MASTKSKESKAGSVNIEPMLEQATKKLSSCRTLKKGVIVVRTTGPRGVEYSLESSERDTRLVKRAAMKTPPLIEIIGEARRLDSILAGKKDAVAQFLVGGIRVRGDLRYLSDLALEFGILKKPL